MKTIKDILKEYGNSLSESKRLIAQGQVLVDGELVKNLDFEVKGNPALVRVVKTLHAVMAGE
jgi:ribosomal protein S4E